MNFRDTEGAKVPQGWHLSIWADGELSILLPFEYVDLGEEYYQEGGMHVLTVNLKDVLDEFLADWRLMDEPEDVRSLVAMLREFAEKLENDVDA